MNSTKYIRDKVFVGEVMFPYILLGLYYCQGLLYPSGTLISQVLLVLFILVSFYCYFKEIGNRNNPVLVNIWTVFTLLQIITFIVSPKTVVGAKFEAIGVVPTFQQMKGIFAYCLSLYVGINVGVRKLLSHRTLAWIGLGILILSIGKFFLVSIENMEEYGKEVTNNAAYNFVSVIPFVPSMFKVFKKVTIAVILATIFFTIAGAKRGAIVCTLVSLLFYGIWYIRNTRLSVNKMTWAIILSVLLVGFVMKTYSGSELLQERMERTQEVGIGAREIAYTVLFNHWLDDENVLTKFFGNGSAQSVTVWGNFAHNDWLELLIDNGLFGVILYAAFFITATNYVRRNKVISKTGKITSYLVLIGWFLKTCFSMGYTDAWNALTFILFGFVVGNSMLVKKLEKKKRKLTANTPYNGGEQRKEKISATY